MSLKPMATKKPPKSDELDGLRKPGTESKPPKYVFYGRSGTGKTTIAGTFPTPSLLINIRDDGDNSVADVAGMLVKDIDDCDELEEVFWWLKRNPDRYKTVIIDTVTQWQSITIEKVLLDKKKTIKKAGDWGSMTKREWGDVAQYMKSWIVNFSKLPCEVVFLAQDRTFNFDEDTDQPDENLTPEVGPRLSPSVASTLNAQVSFIGNTFIRMKTETKEVKGKKIKTHKIQYCLRVGPSPTYITKMRKPKGNEPPAFIIDPNYEDLREVINGE